MHVFFICHTMSFSNVKIPTVIAFSTNKYMPMSEMSYNSFPVILSIAFQFNSELLT